MHHLFAAPAWRWAEPLPECVKHPSGLAEQPAVLRRI
jgi:hypothetical protein